MSRNAALPRAEWSFEELRDMLIGAGVARSAAEKEARRRLNLPSPDTIQAKHLAAEALEKEHVAEGDKIVRALGGKVVSFSQPRASKQTPGIPDRRYYFPRIMYAFWWEAKAEGGEQSPAQKDFQAMCTRCFEPYILGELSELKAHLQFLKLCTINPDGSIEPVHQPEV